MDKIRCYVLCRLRPGISTAQRTLYFAVDRCEFPNVWWYVSGHMSLGTSQDFYLSPVPVSETCSVGWPRLQYMSNSIGVRHSRNYTRLAKCDPPAGACGHFSVPGARAGANGVAFDLNSHGEQSKDLQRPAPRASLNPGKFPGKCGLAHPTKRWEIPNDLMGNKVPLVVSR